MNLEASVEQQELGAAARSWLARELPIDPDRGQSDDLATPVLDDRTWQRCADLGWLGLGAPTGVGGLGLGAAEEVMLFHELGRALAPGPFLASVLGAHVAAAAGAAELASDIVAGRRRVAAAIDGRVFDGGPGSLALTVTDDLAELVEVVDAVPVESLDPLVRVARLTSSTPLLQVADPLVRARANTLLAAQLHGIIEAVRDMSVAYALTRTQFGRPIGAFQAVKHRCADMAVAAYASVGQLRQAALYVDAHHPDAAFHAACAYLVAARGAARSAADNIQNHGGIGFTWEHPAHLYLKRATVLSNLLGPLGAAHRAVMAPARHEFG